MVFWDTVKNNANIERVKAWVKAPMRYNKEIRQLSRQCYDSNGVLTNTVDYMVSMPYLNRIIHGSEKDNKVKFKKALEQIKDKETIRNILHTEMINGLYFGYFVYNETNNSNNKFLSDADIQNLGFELNENDFKCTIMDLPIDYCKIVGLVNSDYQVAMNVSYFDEFVTGKSQKIMQYPKEIRDGYKAYLKEKSRKWVKLNVDNVIVTKIRASRKEQFGRPIVLAALDDILFSDYFADTQRATLDNINGQIFYQTFPEGTVKGESSLSDTDQTNQHNNLRNAIFNRRKTGVNFLSVAAGTKIDKLDVSTDILNTKTEDKVDGKISMSLGFSGSALSGNGNGNYSTNEQNMDLVSREVLTWVEEIQSELNRVINANVIKDKNNKIQAYYLPITNTNSKSMVGYAKDLYTTGKGSMKFWIASCGFDPDIYLKVLDDETEEGLEDKYPIHKISYTQSNDGQGGAPKNDNPTNPNTINSKTNKPPKG